MLETIPKKSAKTNEKVEWLINQVIEQDKRLDDLGAPQADEIKSSPSVLKVIGYTLLIALVMGVFYLIFLFTMQQMGHNIVLPQFLK